MRVCVSLWGARGAAEKKKNPFGQGRVFFFLSFSLSRSLFTLPLFFFSIGANHRLFLFFFPLSLQKHRHGQLRLSLRAGDCGGKYTYHSWMTKLQQQQRRGRGKVLDDDDGEKKKTISSRLRCGGSSSGNGSACPPLRVASSRPFLSTLSCAA